MTRVNPWGMEKQTNSNKKNKTRRFEVKIIWNQILKNETKKIYKKW